MLNRTSHHAKVRIFLFDRTNAMVHFVLVRLVLLHIVRIDLLHPLRDRNRNRVTKPQTNMLTNEPTKNIPYRTMQYTERIQTDL